MEYSFRLSMLFVIFNCLNIYSCLEVSIKENHDIVVEPFKTRINKRDISQFFDKASYSFNGVEKFESVPIVFPLDICLFMVNEVKHAACLHVNKDGVRNFVIFRDEHETYKELLCLETPQAVAMDCKSFGQKGIVALAYNISKPVERANKGSPIFQIDSERIKTIQYFGSPNLKAVYLRATANDLFLLQTSDNSLNTSSNLFCPYFKWSGYGFTKLGRIPCSNARHLEPFSIDSDSYIAVANYADKHGRTETNSEIYKYDREKKKLVHFQKIKTNAAVDVKYFSVPLSDVKKQHFLIFGNSRTASGSLADQLQADSVIYTYEKGNFIPYQSLPLYSVQKFLPVENAEIEKFILLVACSNQDVKIYNLNDWKFEESKVQFTEGALGKGVSNMRKFEDEDHSYLVIANERMLENETNVFVPIFTQEEHANTLRQQIIDWSMVTIELLSKINAEKLRNDVLAAADLMNAQKSTDVTEIPSAKVEIAYTRSLINPQRNLTSSYWETLSYAHQAIEALESRANKKLAKKRHASEEDAPAYVHEAINVGTLVVRNKLKARKINGIDPLNIQLDSVSAPKVIVKGDLQTRSQVRSDTSPEFLDTMVVDHLKISGNLNGFDWANLQSMTLKKTGQQFLKAPVNISNFRADALVTNSHKLNDHYLSKLVPIDGGSYVVSQDIQFAAPIYAKSLHVNERLNNIYVTNGKLGVLELNSEDIQNITGHKIFGNVKLLEPVTISGKIFGELDIMSPNKPIHQPINLTGHYTITGNVNIKKYLAAANIVGASGTHSIKNVLDNGVSVLGPFEGLSMNFEQPIKARNSVIASVNGLDVQKLVRVDPNEVQIIGGQKIFTGDLHVSKGFAEAKTLNGIDVEDLEKRIFTKSGPQNITGEVRFKKVSAKRVTSPSIWLQRYDISTYLTKSGDQVANTSLYVGRLHAQFATFDNLQTEHKVFDHQLVHKERTMPDPEILQHYKGTIHVDNLKVSGFLNEHSIEDIERLLTQLNGNVKYVGGMRLHSDVKISNLTFTGRFNGIPSDKFGNCWLQQGRDQVFTAPQTFASVSIADGLELTGTLNDYNVKDFVSGAYWINRDEHIPSAVFEDSILVELALTATTVNGLRVPEDILLHNSSQPQILNDAVICSKDVYVKGSIRGFSTVNDMNLGKLNTYLDGDLDIIAVEHATFENAPTFATLNAHDLKETIESVWLANEDVDLQHHVEIADGYFEGPLDFQGPINGMNLRYLKENYFSLSKPQQVSAEIIFSKEVVFENDLDGENLHLYGSIVESTSHSEFDFNDFVQNALLKEGKQEITGQWKIYEGLVTGSLNNVQINDLNLADDVIRLDVGHNKVTAPKYILSASIENLYSGQWSTVNGVNLENWIQGSVFVYENYTIEGNTTLDSVILLGDVQVLGTVNNITFNEDTILLRNKDQVIQGDVQIFSKSSDEKKIFSNTFEELSADNINGLNVDEFFEQQVVGRMETPSAGTLTFMNPVYAERFESATEYSGPKSSNENFHLLHNRTVDALAELNKFVQRMAYSYADDKYYLSHFEHKQTIHVSGKKIISLTLRVGDEFVDVIGVLNEPDDSNVIFYRWDFYQQQFVMDKHLSWLPHRKALIDIFRVVFGKAEYLAIETSLGGKFYQNVVSPETPGLQEIFKNNASKMLEALELDGEHCFVAYQESSGVLNVYCVDIDEQGFRFLPKNSLKKDGVLQIVSLENDYIAILLPDSVEIWKPSEVKTPRQKISAAGPSHIAAVVSQPHKYIAICSKVHPKSPHLGAVDIYRSSKDAPFELMQTIEAASPLQVEFALLPESEDILLNILTDNFDEPLAIYQYKGVVGFQPLIGSSTILPGSALSVIHLKASKQHLLAVMSTDDITLIEVVLNKT